MAHRDLVVVGSSAGGIETLRALSAQLSSDFPAAVLAVVHMPAHANTKLDDVLAGTTRLKVAMASHGDNPSPGSLHLAPPDRHVLLEEGRICLSRGPKENGFRPAIDSLFRSAAVAAGPRVIGIVLTGFLDDGSAGLVAIRRCGGVAVVQEPGDAAYPDMPRSAIQAAEPDHVVPVREMGRLLDHLVREEISGRFVVPPDLAREQSMNVDVRPDVQRLNEWGDLVPVHCPECGGPIWEHSVAGGRRYRCQSGHAFSGQTLLAEQSAKIENTLWGAVQTLEEHARTLAHLAEDEERSGQLWMAFAERSAEAREKAQMVRSLLTRQDQESRSGLWE